MISTVKRFELIVAPEVAFHPAELTRAVFQSLHLKEADGLQVQIQKRSIDSRQRQIKVHIEGHVGTRQDLGRLITYSKPIVNVSNASKRVIIVGAGPAGMFAAIRLIELGIKPILLERGKDVRARRFDLVLVSRKGSVDPDSNYCFGEGGAGTYSDGKLYTRSKKRGDARRILEIFHDHGALEDILYDAHPHIGTNLLPNIVANIRQTIIDHGGEVHFNSKVVDLICEGMLSPSKITGVKVASGESLNADAVMLATGHSARDIYKLLKQKNIHIEAKPFALGVRVEHSQRFIDAVQYHLDANRGAGRGTYLPAASYQLVTQTKWEGVEKGVFSFCMCPGGFIVPASTEMGEIVVNGMSPSRRDSPFANSGIVVSVDDSDFKPFESHQELRGMAYQEWIEQRAAKAAANGFTAPASRISDFVEGKVSSSLIDTSYQPGVVACDFSEILSAGVHERLRDGLRSFNLKMKGFVTNDAQLLGVESRTSSPVRIPRKSDSFEHPQVSRLFPVAEGAGYAGGIVSAAMDGERSAEAIARILR